MYSEVFCATVSGIDAVVVSVEVDVSVGLPYFEMSGYLATEVKESKERVKAAIKNSGIDLRPQKIVVNISPANVRKQGTGFDLPIAVGILAANNVVDKSVLEGVVIIGELSLDGSVNGVNGVLPGVIAAKEGGFKRCIVPVDNLKEATAIKGIDVLGVACLVDLLEYLEGHGELNRYVRGERKGKLSTRSISEKEMFKNHMDYIDVCGQIAAKRATLIATAGMHNLLYIGAPGSGKTMLAMRIPTIMPGLTEEESLELTKIYSVAGELDKKNPVVVRRPFRSPHHSVTMAALLGGGRVPRPGEITLANRGVLFLDELTEYPVQLMEALRQPLEDRKIHICRMSQEYVYPADFMLVAAINPCKCGYYPDRNRCNCAEWEIKRYLGKISQPLWDRFDMNVQVQTIDFESLYGEHKRTDTDTFYTSKNMRELVKKARVAQLKRFGESDIAFNSQMNSRQVKEVCVLGNREAELMEAAYKRLGMTVRGYHKVLKIARTIADIEGEERISVKHLSEAISYRSYANR